MAAPIKLRLTKTLTYYRWRLLAEGTRKTIKSRLYIGRFISDYGPPQQEAVSTLIRELADSKPKIKADELNAIRADFNRVLG